MGKRPGNSSVAFRWMVMGVLFLAGVPSMGRPNSQIRVSVDWKKTTALSNTVPTLMVEAHPLLLGGSPIHEAAFAAIKELGARYVRYHGQSMWPHLAVAELEPPTKDQTFWDFSKIDEIVIPFLAATMGHEPVLNFNTVPAWMFKTEPAVQYPKDPDQFTNEYAVGTQFVDPSGHQLAEYYARIVSWYNRGGFMDELGHFHHSGYHYELPWWEVLNEVQSEHGMTPKQYVRCYDAIVAAIHLVSPRTRFIGLSLAQMDWMSRASGAPLEPTFFEYFLNPKNHRPGTPLDMVSYHFYAIPSVGQTINSWQYSVFDQADGFLNTVAFVEAIRRRLSPTTRVDVDEAGIILPEYFDFRPRATWQASPEIPSAYWNLSGALFAYLYVEVARQHIDTIAASQLLGDPKEKTGVADPLGMDPDDSLPLLDWKTGRPNARFRVLELLNSNFGPGDRLVETRIDTLDHVPPDVEIQAFATKKGKKMLFINKRAASVDIALAKPDRISSTFTVGQSDVGEAPRALRSEGEMLTLSPFAVAVAFVE